MLSFLPFSLFSLLTARARNVAGCSSLRAAVAPATDAAAANSAPAEKLVPEAPDVETLFDEVDKSKLEAEAFELFKTMEVGGSQAAVTKGRPTGQRCGRASCPHFARRIGGLPKTMEFVRSFLSQLLML